ncbi:Rab GDP dissociation inhibitor, putative [Hondaea fermentalgiana]|uniref:Rab GDP dissociation inhibitor, putative n=1 Tax=Hondaea fermentalgiana TaxID=2315210 RepID=A0A2R5GH05_9STRA|nr:Rab GDP dissociation inhibitor, putative [Hondaea fermentalgiana]|eukprot:GBG27551.1 Rab GDP dissociation inhibitor, putative [Hondaea fermentalgiana]
MLLGEEVCREVFDCVVVGTGLSETAVACALTLDDPDKKVLVLDPASYYGGLEATVQPRELSTTNADLSDGSDELGDKQKAEPKQKPNQVLCGWDILSVDGELSNAEARRCNLDLRPRFVLCRGKVVDALVRSGVSNYLEFQSLDDALFLDTDGTVMRVPCSKAAVFKSKDLGMGEKRQLMRFLQFCMDSATVQRAGGQAEALKFRNEESLNQGRSLARPQNKREAALSPATNGTVAADDDDIDFADFLRTQCKLSPRLAAAILYAVALLPDARAVSKAEGMRRVQKYLGGLGRFGVTAFLCPMYGTAELAQAFGRLGSVHGGIFVLRQPVSSFATAETGPGDHEGPVVRVRLQNGETVHARTVVAAEHAVPATTSLHEPDSSADKGDEDEDEDGDGAKESLVEVRCMSIINAPLLSLLAQAEDDKIEALLDASALRGHPPEKRAFPPLARCLMVVAPGNDLARNTSSVHVIQLDSTAEATAPGLFVIHLTTTASSRSEGQATLARILDNLLARANARISDLPSRSPPNKATPQDQGQGQSQGHKQEQGQEQSTGTQKQDAAPQIEIRWQANFARVVRQQEQQQQQYVSGGVTMIPSEGLAVDTEDYLTRAEAVFHALRPGDRAFLPAEAERAVRNPHADEDDGLGDMVKRVRVPQPVDLRWFLHLGGKLGASGASIDIFSDA